MGFDLFLPGKGQKEILQILLILSKKFFKDRIHSFSFLFFLGFCGLYLLVNKRLHVLHVAVLHFPAVYENRRCSSNSQFETLVVILSYPGRLDGALPILIKLLLIQFELRDNFLYLLVIEAIVIFKKFVVKFPEFVLAAGGQSRHGCLNGKFMTSNREILENDFYIIGIFFEQLLELRHKLRAVPSLKVTEHRNNNRGIDATL